MDIPSVVEKLWVQLQTSSELQIPPKPLRLTDGLTDHDEQWAVMFGVDSDNSVDSAVAAVMASLPGLAVHEALVLSLYAGRAGGHAIAYGHQAAAERCCDSLKKHGIKNCRVERPEDQRLLRSQHEIRA